MTCAGRLRGGADDQRAPPMSRLQRVGLFPQQPFDIVGALQREGGGERQLGAARR